MKRKIISIFSVFLFLLLSGTSYYQQATIDLQIFEPLPEIDLGSIIIQNNLNGAPKVFYVQITPAGKRVIVKGIIYWDKKDGAGYKEIFSFETDVFEARSFYSDQLGSAGLTLNSTSSNSDLTKDLLEKGKPTGSFKFQLNLLDENRNFLAQTSKEVKFSNPSQTLRIITPVSNSIQSVGSIIARWSAINGAANYKIRLGQRINPSQSLEDALESGTPLINDKIVSGEMTNVDLRTLLDREWLPGQELVLRVSASVGGVGGGAELNSEIVNFTIANSNEAPVDDVKSTLIALLNRLQNDQASQFASALNNVPMENIKFYNDQGSEITFAQFQALFNSVLSSVVKVTLTNQ